MSSFFTIPGAQKKRKRAPTTENPKKKPYGSSAKGPGKVTKPAAPSKRPERDDEFVGNQFIRGDEAEEAWRVLDPILKAWEKQPPPDLPNYAAGTMGPEAADEFLKKDGRRWRTLGKE